MVEEDASLRDILWHLASTVEEVSRGRTVASILLLDDEGLLRNGASPSLPADYLAAIDRLKPDASLGTGISLRRGSGALGRRNLA